MLCNKWCISYWSLRCSSSRKRELKGLERYCNIEQLCPCSPNPLLEDDTVHPQGWGLQHSWRNPYWTESTPWVLQKIRSLGIYFCTAMDNDIVIQLQYFWCTSYTLTNDVVRSILLVKVSQLGEFMEITHRFFVGTSWNRMRGSGSLEEERAPKLRRKYDENMNRKYNSF